MSPANPRVTSSSIPSASPPRPSLPTERSHLHLLIEALKAGLGGCDVDGVGGGGKAGLPPSVLPFSAARLPGRGAAPRAGGARGRPARLRAGAFV